MESRFWRQMWRAECERARYFIGVAVTEGLIIAGLAAVLVWVLR